jgi:hypothetical protein
MGTGNILNYAVGEVSLFDGVWKYHPRLVLRRWLNFGRLILSN